MLIALVILLIHGIFFWLNSKNGSKRRSVTVALAGPMGTENGQEMLRGASLFLDEMKQLKGFEDMDVKLLAYDDHNRQTAVKIANQISNENKVILVLGHYTSDSSLAAGTIYRKKGIPAITASATAEKVTLENDWFFRTVSNNASIARFAAGYMRKMLGVKSSSLIYTNDVFGASATEHFMTSASDMDISITKKIALDVESPTLHRDIKNISGRMRAMEYPGMLFFSTHASEAAEYLSSLRYPGTNYPVMGPDSLASPEFVSELNRYEKEKKNPGYYSNGIYAVSHFFADLAGPKGLDFQQRFIQKYQKSPSWVAACYYDAMLMAVAAIQRAEVGGQDDILQDRKKVREALARFNDPDNSVKGVAGDIFFDKHGNSIKPLYMGIWDEQTLLPAFWQYRPRPFADAEDETIMLDGMAFQKAQVVYVGIDINDISRLDLKNGLFRADFYLWFRSGENFDIEGIIFTNANVPIHLDQPFETYWTRDGVMVRSYRVVSDFTVDFDAGGNARTLDRLMLPIRLRHADIPESKLVFIPDVPGYPIADSGLKPRQQDEKKAQTLAAGMTGSIPGWRPGGVSFQQEIIKKPGTQHAFSQFNAEIQIIQKNRIIFMVKTLLPYLLFLMLLYGAYLIPADALFDRILLLAGIAGAAALLHYLLIWSLPLHPEIDRVFQGMYMLSATAALFSGFAYWAHKKGMNGMKRFFNGTGKWIHILSALGLFVLMIWKYSNCRILLKSVFKTFLTAALVFVLMPGPMLLAEEAPMENVASKAPELYKLSNEELIQKASSSFTATLADFHAQLRGVYTYQILLQRAQEKTAAVLMPVKPADPEPGSEDAAPLEIAKTAAAYAEARLEALVRRLDGMMAEKNMLDALIKHIETAIAGAVEFLKTAEGLDIFLLEIKWRLADGTIAADSLPDFADEQFLSDRKQTVQDMKNLLELKAKAAQNSMEALLADMDEVRKDLIEAKARKASEDERYAQERKRQTLETTYAERSLDQLEEQFSEFQDERIWLNGAFNLTHGRFLMRKRNADEKMREIEAASPPESVLQQPDLQSKEMEDITRRIESIITYHTERIENLEKYHSALQAVIKAGENFKGDATVLGEHLFKMQVIANLLDQAETQDKISQRNRPEALAEAGESLSVKMTEVGTVIDTAKNQMEQIKKDIQKSTDAAQEARHRLASLKKKHEAALQTRKWEAALKDLAALEIVKQFQETSEQLVQKQETMERIKVDFDKASNMVEQTRLKLESLKDPMLRSAENESRGEKDMIQKTLYEMAGFESPPAATSSPSDTEDAQAPARGGNLENGADKHKDGGRKEPSAADKGALLLESEIRSYQNLLSARYRIIDQQRKGRGELLESLTQLEKHIKDYVAALQEGRQIVERRHANAVELKKRLGRSELDANQIPDGITEALKPDLRDALEAEAAKQTNYQAHILREIEKLGSRDEVLEKIGTTLSDIQENAGRRLGILQDLQKLNASFQRGPESLSATEAKSLEQQAIRRMEKESSSLELLVSFVPSERSKSMTDLLLAYYRDMMELERKRNIMADQTQAVEGLIRLSEQEKTFDGAVLTILSEQIKQLKLEEEELWVKIKAQLMPEKSLELLENFEMKTGRAISPPPPIIEKYKKDMVDRSIETLFAKRVAIAAAEKWIDLFQKRLSLSGIPAEIGRFQDRLGAIQSHIAGIDRSLWELVGYPPAELSRLTADEERQNSEDRNRLLKGKMGTLREDLHRVRREAALGVVGKLSAILLIAALVTLIVNIMVNRIRQRFQNEKQKKSVSAVSLLPLFKTIFLFFIWIVAVISCLSALGFNVGAILAGLGIGGLAVAMASKEMLADIIGGVSILISKSFQIGDAIMFKNQKAVVEEIGLRYTRLRYNATNFLVTAPNSLLAQSEAINISSSPAFYVNTDLPLSICNSMEQVRAATECISQVIDQNPDAKLKNLKFVGFQNYSFLLSFRYIISDYDRRHAIRTDIHSEIVGQFRKNGIELASVPHTDMGK